MRNDAEAEEVVQDAHLLVFTHLEQFAGRSSFGTWLTRITVNEAVARSRRPARRPPATVSLADTHLETMLPARLRDPEQQASDGELRRALQAAVDALPPRYRAVFLLREIQEMSTPETARRLGISDACVKTRLLRARRLVRERLSRRAPSARRRHDRPGSSHG